MLVDGEVLAIFEAPLAILELVAATNVTVEELAAVHATFRAAPVFMFAV